MSERGFESGQIDPRLIEHFSLIREPGPGPDGPLDDEEIESVELLREIAVAGRMRSLVQNALVFDEVRKVVLSPARTVLVIPGRAGVHVKVLDRNESAGYGAGARVEGRLEGRPVLSIGPTLVGLAIDGVDAQAVEFRDGSVGHAPVRHNVYCIDHPAVAPTTLISEG